MSDYERFKRSHGTQDNALKFTRRGILQVPAMATAASVLSLGEGALTGAAAQPAASLTPQDSAMPLPGAKTAADYPVSEAMTRLSAYISQTRGQALAVEVQEKTKWHLLDSLAAMVSGSQLAGGEASIRFAQAYGGKPVSTVIGSETLCGPIEAALANGTMGHSDETDDFLRQWHPGISVVPAALALGEQFHVSGAHFLRAVAVGYDVGTRVKDATGVAFGDPRVATEGLGGTFGATAAAACAASLTEQQTRWALSYGAQQWSGIDSFRRDLDHIEKGFLNGGMGARSGVTSALLVLAGFNAVNDIFSGPASFFTGFGAAAKPEMLVDKLGERNEIINTNFKRWPVGSPIQPLLDAIQALQMRQTIDPRQVREIVIQNGYAITDNAGSTALNAQHAVALMLVDKKLNFRNVHDKARLKDPMLVRLRSVVKEIAPAPQEPMVQITLEDGTRLSQPMVRDIFGSDSRPFTREWVVGKARHLMTPVLGAARVNELIERILRIEDTRDIVELRPLLQRKPGPPQLSDWPMP